jgi:hypothetical protein
MFIGGVKDEAEGCQRGDGYRMEAGVPVEDKSAPLLQGL